LNNYNDDQLKIIVNSTVLKLEITQVNKFISKILFSIMAPRVADVDFEDIFVL
jgi:hypothetical protein